MPGLKYRIAFHSNRRRARDKPNRLTSDSNLWIKSPSISSAK